MAGDFNPVIVFEERPITTGNRADTRFYPADDSAMAVAYMNATPGEEAAVGALLSQIEAKCDVFVKKQWLGIDSDPGKRAMVDIRVIVAKDDEG